MIRQYLIYKHTNIAILALSKRINEHKVYTLHFSCLWHRYFSKLSLGLGHSELIT